MNVGRMTVFLGLVLILHSGISSARHRSLIRLSEVPYEGLPIDIFVQCIIGFLIASFGITKVAGEFRDISATTDMNSKTMDSITNIPSFYHFAHRGRVIHSILY